LEAETIVEGSNNDHVGMTGEGGLNPMIRTQRSNQPNNNARLIAKAMEKISQRRQKQRGNDVGQGGGIGLEKGETGRQRQGI
jgi:hypothetical protein